LMMLSFTSLACCSIAIPDSIDLARAIGEPFDESSIPVSIFRLGTCCGGVAVFLIERHWQLNQLGSPDSMPLSLGRFRLLLLLVLACELSGAVGYTIVTSSIRAKDDSAGSSLLWAVLLLSRWTMGVGDGINFSSIYLFIMGAHAAAERGPKLAHWQTVNIFAIGLGPILSSCATVLPSYARFANVGWVQLTLLSASLAVFILCYPSLDDVPSIEASDTDAATAAPGLGAASRWLVVLGGLLITGLRNFAVGGLEVGSASLLEVQLAFSAKALGLMIGLAFIACTLVRGAYLTLQHGLSNDGWVRAHALLAVIASALFFRGWGGAAWEHHCTPSGIGCDRTARAAFLLVGDALAFGAHLYGSALTSNAHAPPIRARTPTLRTPVCAPCCRACRVSCATSPVSEAHTPHAYACCTPPNACCQLVCPAVGIMARNLIPGTCLDANHVTLWNLSATSLTRFVAPITTRLLISAGGQDTYAASQVALALLAWLAFELMMVRRPSPKQGEQTSLLATTDKEKHAA
jgi:hypothetical protein